LIGGEVCVERSPGVGSTFWSTARIDRTTQAPNDREQLESTRRGALNGGNEAGALGLVPGCDGTTPAPDMAPPQRQNTEREVRRLHSGRCFLLADDNPINPEVASDLPRSVRVRW
jgi:hypothetical protein